MPSSHRRDRRGLGERRPRPRDDGAPAQLGRAVRRVPPCILAASSSSLRLPISLTWAIVRGGRTDLVRGQETERTPSSTCCSATVSQPGDCQRRCRCASSTRPAFGASPGVEHGPLSESLLRRFIGVRDAPASRCASRSATGSPTRASRSPTERVASRWNRRRLNIDVR